MEPDEDYTFCCEFCEGELELHGHDEQFEYWRCVDCKKVRVTEKPDFQLE